VAATKLKSPATAPTPTARPDDGPAPVLFFDAPVEPDATPDASPDEPGRPLGSSGGGGSRKNRGRPAPSLPRCGCGNVSRLRCESLRGAAVPLLPVVCDRPVCDGCKWLGRSQWMRWWVWCEGCAVREGGAFRPAG